MSISEPVETKDCIMFDLTIATNLNSESAQGVAPLSPPQPTERDGRSSSRINSITGTLSMTSFVKKPAVSLPNHMNMGNKDYPRRYQSVIGLWVLMQSESDHIGFLNLKIVNQRPVWV